MSDAIFRKSILYSLFLGLFITLAGVGYMRPTADDYWFSAYVAQYGVWGATLELWNTWTSFVFSALVTNVLVGLPLATLPLGISSAIPFWIASLTVAYISYAFLVARYVVPAENKLLLFCLCLFIWISFSFIDSLQFLMLTHHFKHRIALGIVHWQNLNAAYVFCTCLFILPFLYFFQTRLSLVVTFFFACVLGIAMGMMGIAVMLSFVSVTFCIMCWQGYFKQLSQQRLLFYIAFIVFSFVSTVWSMKLSPGHAIRMAKLEPNMDFTLERLTELFLFTFVPTLHRLSELYLNLGTVLTLGILVLFWLTIGKNIKLKPGMSTKHVALFITFMCFVFAAVTRFSQAFSYSKPWHFIPTFLLLHLSLFFWALCIAEKLQHKVQSEAGKTKAQWCFLILLCVHIAFTTAGVTSIYEREKLWAVGPAPVRDGNDIEKEIWLNYWNDLNTYRKTPFEERKPK